MAPDALDLRIHAIACEAEGILSFDLRRPGGGALPSFEAGAHVDLMLPDNLARSYSLVSPPDERHRYSIAVSRDPASRGGSAFLCDHARPGGSLSVMPPRSSFPLVEDAELSVFIAGGIGITPIWCMIQRLNRLARPWRLFFASRSRSRAAFIDAIQASATEGQGRVTTAFRDEPGTARLDLAAILTEPHPPGTHFYACGPAGMLQAFEVAGAGRPPHVLHRELFGADQAPARGGFEVVLARSGRTFTVPENGTILASLRHEGLTLASSCQEGVCGTCETAVLEGLPDHRDAVLSPRERKANDRMMICVSGCLGDRLVLDL